MGGGFDPEKILYLSLAEYSKFVDSIQKEKLGEIVNSNGNTIAHYVVYWAHIFDTTGTITQFKPEDWPKKLDALARKNKESVNQEDNDMDTPLSVAITEDYEDVAKYLVEVLRVDYTKGRPKGMTNHQFVAWKG